MKGFWNIFNQILAAIDEAFDEGYDYFLDLVFPDRYGLISKEVRKILAHPEDRKKYLDAIDQLGNGMTRITFILHNGDEFTICTTDG